MAISTGGGGGDDHAEPMMDINTTPLIDVMLVMLIMLIITIPIQTHAVKLDLPQNNQNNPPPPVDPVKNKVVITRTNQVLWNGTPVDLVTLRQYLDLTTTMTPVPELHLQPEPSARYELVDEVLAVTKRANITAMGFVGNEAYAGTF
jgi:biopolymer transport protein ExbD